MLEPLVVVLNGGALRALSSHLSGLLTGEDLGSLTELSDLVHQLGLGHELAGVDGPVSADHAGGLGIVAELNEQRSCRTAEQSAEPAGSNLTVADTG
ncbi:MAG: hypothetical protein ACLSHJ_12545 [Oscillospiraceae bacterium]